MKTVSLLNDSLKPIPRRHVLDLAAKLKRFLLKHLPQSKAKSLSSADELVIVFVSSKRMKQLNKDFRNKNYVTDVLSFATDDPSCLGELVVCPSQIKKQAKEHSLTYLEELDYMLIHGVLHLLGYDHEASASAARRMFRLQDSAFESLSRRPRRARKS